MSQESRNINCQIIVPASIERVWQCWTTEEGLQSFMAPEVRIQMEPGGAFEIYFNPDAPEGKRGSEGMHILALQEPTFISFTWNAPPHLEDVRQQMTHVDVNLVGLAMDSTRVHLLHGGWGEDGQWEAAHSYFARAWPRVVLPRLRYRFEFGPVDWSRPPDLDS